MCHNILSMPIRWHKKYWKESLTIKGSTIYQLAKCLCVFLHYLIELFYTSNIILRLFVSVIIRIICMYGVYGYNDYLDFHIIFATTHIEISCQNVRYYYNITFAKTTRKLQEIPEQRKKWRTGYQEWRQQYGFLSDATQSQETR